VCTHATLSSLKAAVAKTQKFHRGFNASQVKSSGAEIDYTALTLRAEGISRVPRQILYYWGNSFGKSRRSCSWWMGLTKSLTDAAIKTSRQFFNGSILQKLLQALLQG
jgi:hypothetical protein